MRSRCEEVGANLAAVKDFNDDLTAMRFRSTPSALTEHDQWNRLWARARLRIGTCGERIDNLLSLYRVTLGRRCSRARTGLQQLSATSFWADSALSRKRLICRNFRSSVFTLSTHPSSFADLVLWHVVTVCRFELVAETNHDGANPDEGEFGVSDAADDERCSDRVRIRTCSRRGTSPTGSRTTTTRHSSPRCIGHRRRRSDAGCSD